MTAIPTHTRSAPRHRATGAWYLLAATTAVLHARPATAQPAAAQPAAAQPAAAQPAAAQMAAAVPERDGQHDFDFEFGRWTAHLRRLLHPLTGSTTWVEADGVSIVRTVWDGRANLGEIRLDGPSMHVEGSSFRLYDPQSHQWSIYWANSADGHLGTAMVGQFRDGRGEFYDQELYQGRAIYVRFIFSDLTPTSFRLEQAFSADGGRTWEPNWIVAFRRERA